MPCCDAAGRTTSVTSASGTTNLAYDYESRITSINGPGISSTYTYNGLNTRVGRTSNVQGSFTYRRDGAGVTAPVLGDGTAKFTPGGTERRGSTSAFRQSDYLGSTTRITNSSQSVTDTRQYDAFGQLVSSTGSTATPFGFVGDAGYQSDADTGLQLLGHRYYDPSTGRFLTRDPISSGRNWYQYCDNNPLKHIDPTGNDWDDFWDVVGVFDPTGVVDLVHAATYLARGRPGDAALTAAGALPFGDAGKLAKAGRKATKAAEAVVQVPRGYNAAKGAVKVLGKAEKHHFLSKQYRDWFLKRGMTKADIDEITLLDQELHKLIHGKGVGLENAWNDQWAKWIKKNPKANAEQIRAWKGHMRRAFGI